jgi:hypothetical protein
MEHKGVIPLMKKLDVTVIDFDELDNKDWVEVKPKDSHWENGFYMLSQDPPLRGCLHHVTETPRRGSPHTPAWL